MANFIFGIYDPSWREDIGAGGGAARRKRKRKRVADRAVRGLETEGEVWGMATDVYRFGFFFSFFSIHFHLAASINGALG